MHQIAQRRCADNKNFHGVDPKEMKVSILSDGPARQQPDNGLEENRTRRRAGPSGWRVTGKPPGTPAQNEVSARLLDKHVHQPGQYQRGYPVKRTAVW